MKLIFVLLGWLAAFVAVLALRLSWKEFKEAVTEGVGNVWHGFVFMLKAAVAIDTDISDGDITLGGMVGGVMAILLMAIPAAFLWTLFQWSIEWAMK